MNTQLVAMADLRSQAAAALVPVEDADPPVLVDIVDSFTPPALMLDWDDPWLEPGVGLTTLGPCLWTARLQVVCLAARLEPGAGVEVLEALVAYVIGRMTGDDYTWPIDSVSAPLQRDVGGIPYLAANVIYAVPTTV